MADDTEERSDIRAGRDFEQEYRVDASVVRVRGHTAVFEN